jgi:hypothetical protein
MGLPPPIEITPLIRESETDSPAQFVNILRPDLPRQVGHHEL